jgi:hypothetical protein
MQEQEIPNSLERFVEMEAGGVVGFGPDIRALWRRIEASFL